MGNLASPKPLRLGHAQAREWLGMALGLRYFGFAEDSLVSAESK